MLGVFEIWMMVTNGILALISMTVNYLDRVIERETVKAETVG